MYSVEIEQTKRLLVITASGHVSTEDVSLVAKRVRELIKDAEPGIRALTDLRWMTSMDATAAPHIADIMDMLREKKVASVTRVVPDPHKDIGFNILSQFHYDRHVQIYTFDNMAEA